MNNSRLIDFKTIFMELLNKVSLLKTKYLRANYSKFMTKELNKDIMLRTKLYDCTMLTKLTYAAELKYNK